MTTINGRGQAALRRPPATQAPRPPAHLPSQRSLLVLLRATPQRQTPSSWDRRSAGASRGGGARSPRRREQPPTSNDDDDYVVIGRAEQPASSYLPDLSALEGGAFWEAAVADGGDASDDDDGEEGGEEGEPGVRDPEAAAADAFLEMLDDLAAELEAVAGDGGAEAARWARVYTSDELPETFVGPLRVQNLPGRGRGLVTTAAVSRGATLLVSEPLVLLYCNSGSTPENEELAEHLLAATGSFSQHQLDLLALLAPDGQQGRAGHLPLPPSLNALVRAASGGGGSGGDEARPSGAPAAGLMFDLVNTNVYSEEFEDPVLCALRGSSSAGHAGLWPALAMANHSCCPNALAYAIGGRMVLRAAEDIPAGQEVTISYLGQTLTAPLTQRRAELQELFGFECGCTRCRAEARFATAGPLADLLQVAHARAGEVSAPLSEAVEAGDVGAVEAAHRELQDLRQRLEDGIRDAKPPSNVRRWLQASAYDLYDLLSLCADALPNASAGGAAATKRPSAGAGAAAGGGALDTESLAVCARIVGAVAFGSDAHVELATEYRLRAEARFGEAHQEARDAAKLCGAATGARYGPGAAAGKLLELLVDVRAGLE